MGCGASKVSAAPALVTNATVLSLTPADKPEAAAVIGRAFAGTPTAEPEWVFHWALGPQFEDRANPDRALICDYMLAGALAAFQTAYLLGVRGPDGALKAVCCCWRSPGGPRGEGASMCAALSWYLKTPMPPAIKQDKKLEPRMNALDRVMKALHKKHAPGPHYYVSMLAVEPSEQGQKLGSQLIRALSCAADAEGIPCYLEASGTRTRDIYVHLGYEEKERTRVGIASDVAGHGPFEDFFAMVRPAGGASK